MIYPWHQTQWQNIQRQRKADKLAHGLLLTGPEGLGKAEFACALAASLLCERPGDDGHACGQCASCQLIEAGTHPDLSGLMPEDEGKAIKVDEVRQLSSRLNLTSQFGGYRIAILQQADAMNINASNSLLKTLEEPGANTLLILVSAQPMRLPVTVRSRCQQLSFSSPPRSQALEWLQQSGTANAETLLDLAHGAPLLAAQLEALSLLDDHSALVASISGQGKSLVDQAEDLHKRPLGRLLNWFYDWVMDLVRLHQCGDSASLVHEQYRRELQALLPRTQLTALYDMLDMLIQNRNMQSIPLNTQLLWEDLLLSWNKSLK